MDISKRQLDKKGFKSERMFKLFYDPGNLASDWVLTP